MYISVIYKKDSWLNAFKYAGKSQLLKNSSF